MAFVPSSVASPVERPDPAVGDVGGRYGCAWFLDVPGRGPRDPSATGGWASIGGRPAFAFGQPSELPPDIVWWTNLNRAEHWSFGRLKRFKESSVFGPELNLLMEESDVLDATPEARVMRWSETMARLASWLSYWAADVTPDEPWEWGEGRLSDALRSRLLPPDQAESLHVEQALTNAYCEDVRCEWPRAQLAGKRAITLSLPRRFHADRILQETLIPQGHWHPVDEWPEAAEARADWVEDAMVPVLVQVDQIRFRASEDPAWAGTSMGALWLGQRGRRFQAATMEPVWMTQNDMVVLRKFASFDPIAAYRAEGWASLARPEGLVGAHEGPLAEWSVAKGLLATAVWQALGSPGRDPEHRRKGKMTSRAVWLRAQDRLYTFAAASIMQSLGYLVLGYGNGQVKIAFDETGSAERLAGVARQAGLVLPSRLAQAAPLESWPWSADGETTIEDVARLDQWLKQQATQHHGASSLSVHAAIDRLVMPWPGTSAKQALTEAANRLLEIVGPEKTTDNERWRAMLRDQARRAVDQLKDIKNRSVA